MSPADPISAGAYVNLDTLIALRPLARGFSFLPSQPIHSLLAGRHASRIRGRGLNFEEIRRYQSGDDVRQIDWKATVRTCKTQLRVFTEERERSVLLVIDQRLSMFFGSVRNMKSVTAAEVSALAAWRVLHQKDKVGALIFNDTRAELITPQRSSSAVMRFLHKVVEFNQALSIRKEIASDPAILNHVLQQAAHLATHDFLVCVITDGTGHDEETKRHLSRIAAHNDVIIGLISDPMEEALPQAGELILSDGTRQLSIDTSSSKLRSQFHDRRTRNVAHVKRFLLQRETPVLQITTAEPAANQLRRILGGSR